MLGCGEVARSLLEILKEDHCQELCPDAVVKCIYNAAPLPSCQSPQA